MKTPTTNPVAKLIPPGALDVASVEAALIELLDAVQADRVPSAAQQAMHEFYDRFERWRDHFLHHFAPFVCDAQSVFDVSASKPHLLDLGCGVATQAHLLALRGATITGLDNNRRRVAAGQAMTEWFSSRADGLRLDVSLHAEDAFSWLEQQSPGCFDGCYTQFALAYMRPHERMLEWIDRVVRPGGRILFREFNAGNLYNRIVSRVDWLSAAGYHRKAESLGWKLVDQDYYWLFPRQIIGWPATRGLITTVETGLTQLPGVGPGLAAAMTLVFEKPAHA